MRTIAHLATAGAVVALLAAGTALTPVAVAAHGHPAIRVFQSLESFSAVHAIKLKISFDDVATGVALGNPAQFGRVRIEHSAAVTFKTIGSPAYHAQSAPNVLAPFRADNTLEFGDTTMSFARPTHVAGSFLILVAGSNEVPNSTTVVTATDSKGHVVAATVSFQGVVGEQRFIGFDSRWPLKTISWGPATRPGVTSVIAVDDIVIGRDRRHEHGR